MEKRSNWDGSKLQCDFVVNELGSKLSICPVYTNQNGRRWRNGKCLYLVTSGNQAKWFTTSWNKTPVTRPYCLFSFSVSSGVSVLSGVVLFSLFSRFPPKWPPGGPERGFRKYLGMNVSATSGYFPLMKLSKHLR